jgi:leucyl aminopeptidase
MSVLIHASKADGIVRLNYLRELDCIATSGAPDLPPLHALRPDQLEAWRDALPPAQKDYLSAVGFSAKAGEVAVLPQVDGCPPGGAVLGLGGETGPHIYGALARLLPPSTMWRLAPDSNDVAGFIYGFCLGAYRFDALKTTGPAPGARLGLTQAQHDDPAVRRSLHAARAVWLVRDLINTPANLLGPLDLAAAAAAVVTGVGAHADVITNASLAETYPAVHAVGCGSARPPAVLVARWPANDAEAVAPLISICGKGICFDTGGYDLKPAAGMLRMKKDMGGAAVALGLFYLLAEARLPCRIELRLACAENMISGNSFRPLDVVNTRSGLTVEVGNTDAEGRLVLADLLAEASLSQPDVLLDFATLTGAARVALGPDLPAMFCNDDALAAMFLESGKVEHDHVWRLPLWQGYNIWLESDTADLNNVSEKSYAGAIIAALFLQRFVSTGIRWAHFDLYGWNDAARPGRPAGGEAQAMMTAFEAISRLVQGRNRHDA